MPEVDEELISSCVQGIREAARGEFVQESIMDILNEEETQSDEGNKPK